MRASLSLWLFFSNQLFLIENDNVASSNSEFVNVNSNSDVTNTCLESMAIINDCKNRCGNTFNSFQHSGVSTYKGQNLPAGLWGKILTWDQIPLWAIK